jgi:hypothetical protein
MLSDLGYNNAHFLQAVATYIYQDMASPQAANLVLDAKAIID